MPDELEENARETTFQTYLLLQPLEYRVFELPEQLAGP